MRVLVVGNFTKWHFNSEIKNILCYNISRRDGVMTKEKLSIILFDNRGEDGKI